jgi:protease IV
VTVLIRLLLLPFVLLARAILFPLRAYRRKRAAPAGALIEVRLKGLVREGPPRPKRLWPPAFLQRERPNEVHVRTLRKLIDAIVADPRPAGLLVDLDAIGGGWASLEALRSELLRVRSAGKRLVFFLPHGGGNRELYLASAGTIVAPRSADISLVGMKVETHYIKSALDRVGIDVELHARKEFKSAGDRVARDSRSEPDRIQTEAILDAIDRALVAAMMSGRGVDEARARGFIDQGPTHGAVALQRGLIDHIAHDDELPTVIGARTFPATAYWSRRGVGRQPYRLVRPRAIGIVEVHGAITGGASPIARAMGPLAIAERVIADLRAAEHDPRIVGVVLDIDSPGGTVLASDAIWAAAKKLSEKKPIIARMGDVAASGGYWIAVAAKTIVARPLTLTGSIGVVAIRPIAARLAERIGVQRDVIARGRYADLDALTRAPTDDERAVFAREIDAHYESFVEHVARGRGRTAAEIEELARGRVWMGDAALGIGLVDHLGGLDEAIAILSRDLKVLPNGEPRVVAGRPPSRRDPEPRAAALLELLPASLRAEWLPIAAAIEARASVAAIALVALPR